MPALCQPLWNPELDPMQREGRFRYPEDHQRPNPETEKDGYFTGVLDFSTDFLKDVYGSFLGSPSITSLMERLNRIRISDRQNLFTRDTRLTNLR